MKKNYLKSKVGMLGILLNLVSSSLFSQDGQICRTVMPPPEVLTTGCAQNYLNYMPSATSDTVVVNLAVLIQNATAASNAPVNDFEDSTFIHWVENVNYLYKNVQPAVANVPGTPYIPDTRIRFNLVGVYWATGGTPAPPNLNAVRLLINADTDGYGVSGGFAIAHPDDGFIEFRIDTGDFVNHGASISHRAKWLGHELGHIFGLLHPDGAGAYYQGCSCGDDVFDDTWFPDCASGGQCGTNVPINGFFYPNGFSQPGQSVYCGDGAVSNNMMGYSTCSDYFSPKQMAYMHYRIFNYYYNYCSVPPLSSYCFQGANVTTEILPGTNIDYNAEHSMPGDVYVHPGAILNISGCVFMPKDAKIIVAVGGRLVIEGGTIDCVCNRAMWGGIEVQGSYNEFQVFGTIGNTVFDPNQGVCEIFGQAQIKNAKVGVYVGGRISPDGNPAIDLKLAGGVVWIDNSTFTGCYTGVHFTQYGKMKKGTLSHIRTTDFVSTIVRDPAMYISGIPTPMQYGVFLNNITKVDISDNTFTSYATTSLSTPTEPGYNIFNEKLRGTAINAVNSTLYVRKNTVKYFRDGIKASNNYALTRGAVIKSNRFFDNLFGITGNISYAKIDSNYILIPKGLVDTVNIPLGSSKYPWGIYLDNSHTFTLEADTFLTPLPSGPIGGENGLFPPPAHTSYGLIVKNSGSIGGEVKTNCFFRGLNIATQTEQNNPNLQIRCNKYEENNIAWRVNPTSVTGVLGNQGTSCSSSPANQYRANNTFFGCSTGKDKFESYLTSSFNYYYWDNSSTTQDIVLKPCTTAVNNNVNLNPCLGIGQDDPNICPIATVNLVQLKEIREQLLNYVEKAQFDEAADYLISFVQDDEVKKLLIMYYYDKEKFQKMQEILSQLADNKQEKKQFKKFFKVLKQLKQDDKDIKELSNAQKQDIKNVAGTESQAGAFARVLLDFINEKENNIEPEVPFLASSSRIAKFQEEVKVIERRAELGQNIPNPTNNGTVINVYIPENIGSAKIQIINSLGQWITEKVLIKGEQQTQFNTVDFVAGIYFYTLYIDNKAIAAKRMVIVK